MKVCTKCKEEKDLSDFWRDKSRGNIRFVTRTENQQNRGSYGLVS